MSTVDLLDDARKNIENRAKRTIAILNNHNINLTPADTKDLVRIFSGIQNKSIKKAIEKIKLSPPAREVKVEDKVVFNTKKRSFQYRLTRKLRNLKKQLTGENH